MGANSKAGELRSGSHPSARRCDNRPKKRPFVVVDPRAGHGPGIGGFKADSEIGVAMKAGHPCYFIGFLPDPCRADHRGRRPRRSAVPRTGHCAASGGRRQAGRYRQLPGGLGGDDAWRRCAPDLVGPLILAGSPLSYWAGVRGENPMRYTGGLLGGSWLTALTGDLGLASSMAPGWSRTSRTSIRRTPTGRRTTTSIRKIDTEAPRYLEFEQWWGGHVLLNAEEMQFIADKLFVGNKLATGRSDARTERGSTCATFARPSSCSAPRATTSRRRSRRSAGFSIFMGASTTSGRTARRSSIPCTRTSAIWASSFRVSGEEGT